MAGLVAFGDLVFFVVGFAAGYFSKPYIDNAIAWFISKV